MSAYTPVEGFGGYYEVNEDADIRSVDHEVARKNGSTATHKGKSLKPYITKSGYPQVRLSRGGKSQLLGLAKIVATAFHGVPVAPARVKYKDGDRSNVKASNLVWEYKLSTGEWITEDQLPDWPTLNWKSE